jgi:cellulase/cellobiase CelA1
MTIALLACLFVVAIGTYYYIDVIDQVAKRPDYQSYQLQQIMDGK